MNESAAAHEHTDRHAVVVSCSTLHEEQGLLERLRTHASSLTPPTSFISKADLIPSQSPSFDTELYFSHLTSASLGRTLLSAKQLPSTQDFLKDRVDVIGDGAVVVADKQTSGKGRGGNQWSSPDGCLMFTCARSVVIPGESAPFLNYVTCLALIKGIRDVVGPDSGSIRIKWPNDIHVVLEEGSKSSSLKLGGILINSSVSSSGFRVVTGIGINVFNREPTICLDQIIAGRGTNGSLSRERLLARILSRLEECYDLFQSSGFSAMEADYLLSWMHSGQRVRATNAAFAGSSENQGQEKELTIIGVSPSGFLLALDNYGCHYELSPDGNRLDMMNGLLSKRL